MGFAQKWGFIGQDAESAAFWRQNPRLQRRFARGTAASGWLLKAFVPAWHEQVPWGCENLLGRVLGPTARGVLGLGLQCPQAGPAGPGTSSQLPSRGPGFTSAARPALQKGPLMWVWGPCTGALCGPTEVPPVRSGSSWGMSQLVLAVTKTPDKDALEGKVYFGSRCRGSVQARAAPLLWPGGRQGIMGKGVVEKPALHRQLGRGERRRRDRRHLGQAQSPRHSRSPSWSPRPGAHSDHELTLMRRVRALQIRSRPQGPPLNVAQGTFWI